MDALALDPIAAVTAAEPYPYYAQLVSERPFFRDDRLGMWVATSSEAVEAVLVSPALGVRPAMEPIPAAIAGTALGEVFGALVRWQDGTAHAPLKAFVATVLAEPGAGDIAAIARNCANDLAPAMQPAHPQSVRAFAFSLPTLAMATFLGLSGSDARDAITATRVMSYALLPGATESALSAGNVAARALRKSFGGIARSAQLDRDAEISNTVGFLLQGFDATAGLIGNTLVAIAREPSLARAATSGDLRDLERLVAEVARYDSPVHSTRRYARHDVALLEATIRRDESILVVLAAANRDPAANAEPERLIPERVSPRTYTFGFGVHACAGMRTATTIAAVAIEYLLRAGVEPATWVAPGYEPRVNIRIPAP
jgi:cytochrome P450